MAGRLADRCRRSVRVAVRLSADRPDRRRGPRCRRVLVLIHTVAETGSTNDDLAALARDGVAEGYWLRAERQTGGRGRQGRSWQSPSGNIHASTLVRLQPQDPPAATLALVAAVALQEVAEAYAATTEMQLKWPNDLLASGGKIAGILLERIADTVIVGLGVNLEHYPADTLYPATSFRALTGAAPDPDDFVRHLAATFAAWLSRWRNEGLAPVRTRWLDKAHPIGTALSVTGASGDRIEGLFDGLTAEGALRLRLADGSAHVIHAGDVFLI